MSLNFIILPLLFLQLYFVASKSSASSPQMLPHCHEDEAASLLEFRDSLVADQICAEDTDFEYVYRNLDLWKLEGNCCTWDGIECDVRNGHVIGIDLSQSCFYGISINSSSRLFHLLHLQKLNLALNDFSFSEIPTAIGNFSSLASLNLSMCSFTGPIPSQLFHLTNLTSLDLSQNFDLKPNLEILARSLTKLKELDLSGVSIPSPVSNMFANLSSLEILTMKDCELKGEFPSTILNLPKLQVLDVSQNPELFGHFPEFVGSSRPLKYLSFMGTIFSGELPISLGNLGSLIELDLFQCNLKGFIPSSIGNLTKLTFLDLYNNEFQGPLPHSFGNLSQLGFLDLSNNQLVGHIPSSLENLINLEDLSLYSNSLSGQIPSSLGNKLIKLKSLTLYSNQLSGPIPSSFGNLTILESLYLWSNQLKGQIPPQLSNLTHLMSLDLSYNKLHGTVHLDMFSRLENLRKLLVSSNNLSVIAGSNVSASYFGRLKMLGLASCKLREFPTLQDVKMLSFLDLSCNNIHSVIPSWVLNGSFYESLYLNLSHNYPTGFPRNFEWAQFQALDLSFNKLQGSLSLPLASIGYYLVSDNELSGEISPLICNISKVQVLDFSNNNLTGAIPKCLSNLTQDLRILSLHGNNFYGRIPEILEARCEWLRMIDLSNNQLEGPVPRSLSSCTNLEFLNLGNNMISDTFPSWLGSGDALMVLILRSNKFHGAIEEPKVGFEFIGLHIIDLSHNHFNGYLPSKYFQSWNSTIGPRLSASEYLVIPETTYIADLAEGLVYYSMKLVNKGINMEYLKILDYFKVIDLSSNNFSGPIPTSIADVRGLHLLNISNNHLVGPIPPSIGDLTNLEAIDLSQNSLSGEIPQRLEQLNFLAFFSVSGNKFSGSICRGNQFCTFGNVSYEGNEGLCGDPLSRKCGNSLEPPPLTLQKEKDDGNSEMPFYIEWKAVVVGFLSAFIIAALIATIQSERDKIGL